MTRMRPSANCVWPEQNRSVGVGTSVNVEVTGSYSTVENVPAAKVVGSLPEPATSSTLPVRSTTACTARAVVVAGITCQTPLAQASPVQPGAGRVVVVEAVVAVVVLARVVVEDDDEDEDDDDDD